MLNKNVLKNIGGEITDGILLNGDAQKIKVITCPHLCLEIANLTLVKSSFNIRIQI
jgi:hypothetical protein